VSAAAVAAAAVGLLALGLTLWALNRVRELERRLDRERRAPRFDAPAIASALQNVGVVRFNPYHDTGGDYSFAVALLDATGGGVVVTGLYHRDRCRVYAKPVLGWDSTYSLIDEEREAIARARAGGGARPGPE
jgi:hypothetical protein